MIYTAVLYLWLDKWSWQTGLLFLSENTSSILNLLTPLSAAIDFDIFGTEGWLSGQQEVMLVKSEHRGEKLQHSGQQNGGFSSRRALAVWYQMVTWVKRAPTSTEVIVYFLVIMIHDVPTISMRTEHDVHFLSDILVLRQRCYQTYPGLKSTIMFHHLLETIISFCCGSCIHTVLFKDF